MKLQDDAIVYEPAPEPMIERIRNAIRLHKVRNAIKRAVDDLADELEGMGAEVQEHKI